MKSTTQQKIEKNSTANLDWKDLYVLGAIASILVSALVVMAVIAFFIWPYAPREIPTIEIFQSIQTDKLGALMSLDLVLVIAEVINILPLLALYVSLKRVNQSYALIALVFGLMGTVLIFVARPLTDLIYLSNQYTLATTAGEKAHYLAAGEALLVTFDGNAWALFTIFLAVSGLISSMLMLKSEIFKRSTAIIGIIATVPGLFFYIPVIGVLLLFVGTFGGIVWYVMVARDLWPSHRYAL